MCVLHISDTEYDANLRTMSKLRVCQLLENVSLLHIGKTTKKLFKVFSKGAEKKDRLRQRVKQSGEREGGFEGGLSKRQTFSFCLTLSLR